MRVRRTKALKYTCRPYLIIGKGAILVDGVDPGDNGADRLALEHALLLALGEERDLVVNVLQHDKYGGLARQLLSPIIL